MKIEDNHYTYRIETKDSNGGSLDFIDIDTVEPLRCAYDVQDELNLETNEHIKRVEEIVLDANSTEFWYVDEVRTSDTHLVCYFEEVELMASKDHSMVDTDRSVFEYGKINSNEHQDTNFICTHVMDNGVSRIYMSIDKETFEFATFNNETIKHFISNNPVTIWYALRYEVIIPRSLSKGHLLTLGGQTDVTLTTNNEQAKLPIMKFNVGDTQYTLDTNPIHINNTQEGTQIRNIVLEGNTPINYARGNGVNTTEQVSNTRYDFEPFYDGQCTIPNTVEGGYVSAKLYGDTMVNIAKPYGETPLLTATNNVSLCDDLLGANEESIVLADGEITEGRIVGDSSKGVNPTFVDGRLDENNGEINNEVGVCCHSGRVEVPKGTFTFTTGYTWNKVAYYTDSESFIKCDVTSNPSVTSTPPSNASYVIYGSDNTLQPTDGFTWKYEDGTDVYNTIQSVVNPTVTLNGIFKYGRLHTSNGIIDNSDVTEMITELLPCPTSSFNFYSNNKWNKVAFYDENEGFIKVQETNENVGLTLEVTDIPINAKYVRFGFFIDNGLKGLTIKYTDGTDVYPNLQLTQATLPYTLNKLPNGVADYVDVVNKVYVQRVGIVVLDNTLSYTKQHTNGNYTLFVYNVPNLPTNTSYRLDNMLCDKLTVENYNNLQAKDSEFVTMRNGNSTQLLFCLSNNKASEVLTLQTYLASNPIKVLYQLETPIYTPLTEEEIAQLPLSAYKDGYVNLSSDQLTPSFEFRMRASNRYQVDMLETGYYYLNAPVGNVKLGTTNVDVQQMPCIVKVDNVGTGDSGYRLGVNNGFCKDVKLTIDGYYLDIHNGELLVDSTRAASDYIYIDYYENICVEDLGNRTYFDLVFYDENKTYISFISWDIVKNYGKFKAPQNAKYFRVSIVHKGNKVIRIYSPITLAKLPSHRIPTSFTQGMKCGTDFGYWEGIRNAKPYSFRTRSSSEASVEEQSLTNIPELNRLEGNYQGNVIVEDEFDISTGKLTKRIGKIVLDGLIPITDSSTKILSEGYAQISVSKTELGIKCKNSFSDGTYGFAMSDTASFKVDYNTLFNHMFMGTNNLVMIIKIGVLTKNGIVKYFESNPMTIYYELAVPEISYIPLSANQVKTTTDATLVQSSKYNESYLNPQVKPSHLTYPVPSLVGNRTYTVVHNRKNITGSTKPIELNLGGTVVQLNDASSKTLVKTPSTLAHSNLIFIGGESTVDHIMVLDGDWTNKPIEYFENMMGHDTDAIITIIGDSKIDDVAEQYLW